MRHETIRHDPAVTAAEVAAAAHVSGYNFAKTVIVVSGGELAMVVLPAHRQIVLGELRHLLGDPALRLATEAEFAERFSDCELGAMPPFGNLYDMPVYIEKSLSDRPEIAFNAGTHREAIKMSFSDFAELVRPMVVDLVTA